MIAAEALIEKFRYALDNKWGYIWGTAGVQWTSARQKSLVNQYNSDPQKYADKAASAQYGSKWIGHNVADCSGLFYWAFKQLGGYMYHGSNTIWDKYCTEKGTLKNTTDIVPGTAVFCCHGNKRTHIGLYVGDNVVIEAAGTTSGVIKTALSNKKWVEWGKLKGIEYKKSEQTQTAPTFPTVRTGCKGDAVTWLQKELIARGYDCGSIDGIFGKKTDAAVKAFQKDNGLTVDGIVGSATWAKLNSDRVQMVSVCIPNLTQEQAKDIIKKYSGSYIVGG